MSHGDLWLRRQQAEARVASHESRVCESHACQHPERPIVIGLGVDGYVETRSEDGLVFTSTGVRHSGCPCPRIGALMGNGKAIALVKFMDQGLRELTGEEATKALEAAFEKAVSR